jgi:hypothetical protein
VTDYARRPLLFLDVDGPLLPLGGDPQPGPPQAVPAPHLARLRPDTGLRLAALPCTLVPHLPWVIWPEPTEAHEREDRWFGLCWKTRTLLDWAAGRPFAWVDDEITDADRDWVSTHHPGPALLHYVEPSRGLADQDFADLDVWLREISNKP